MVAIITRSKEKRVVMTATAFANRNGMPITLAATIVASLPSSSPLNQTDPIIIITLYLVLYPMLQWGLGAFLFPPSKINGSGEEQTKTFDSIEEGLHVGSERSIGEEEDLALGQPGRNRTIKSVMRKTVEIGVQFCQPVVIASLFGLLVTSVPQLRRLFVNIHPTDSTAKVPLSWMFSSFQTIASAAVPVNMVILGINLSMSCNDFTVPSYMKGCSTNKATVSTLSSSSSSSAAAASEGESTVVPGVDNITNDERSNDEAEKEQDSKMSYWTIAGVILGKMVFMPAVGIISVYGLRAVLSVPDSVASSMYLVMMLMFVTPTANNTIILVELSDGEKAKKDMATLIAFQYLAAPVLLSLSVAAALQIALN